MKFGFSPGRSAHPALPEAASNSSERRPVVITLAGERAARIMVDQTMRWGRSIVVCGWKIGEFQLALTAGKKRISSSTHNIERGDVSQYFPDAKGDLGFVMIAEAGEAAELNLDWIVAGQRGRIPLQIADASQIDSTLLAIPGPARALLARQFAFASDDWKRLTAQATESAPHLACGYLESAIVPSNTEHAIVCGWRVSAPDVSFWLEDDLGNVHSMDRVSWRDRQDVMDSVGSQFGPRALSSGFVAHFTDIGPVRSFTLKAMSPSGVHVLHQIACTQMSSDPSAISHWLFGISMPEAELSRHHELVEGPVLGALIQRSRNAWDQFPVLRKQMGVVTPDPRVSVIVPLYARFDFIENQMVEWVRDDWLREHVELLYVIDDPRLVPMFASFAEEMHRLYKVPFRWTWGGVNRGFSGANNLGASMARGECLLFLNSDVFPQSPGWIQPLLDVLDARPDIGAVGPRLIFAEGGIQHAGMKFERLEEYAVWINRHPYLGLDPELDPHVGLTLMPAITGACMMVRKADFDAVGGWDSGYLIGDFEDSDLCLKLRDAGLSIAYLPSVELVHLERQSMSVLGDGSYRMRVTLWNAMRHQQRWRGLIEASVGEAAA
ncbi:MULTISPECIES: glycosyltransferase family 2 protein [unclassified Lysobacter]|uniref:glycosyltransferase family 2 protein n=1 Tax=unclassified Lysobacter TaxID=2635362 RepID=UPI001BEACB44|nr:MULTISPECIES: glycosyltransferase family 2 protein [unclassified Lysobacter]MBT2748981.1 glycosyltransferase family 2 protein [Lysobacter sp. ISL-42]MBT2751431.1 glycosyltransferase family 2 protein [Lysobacter sp. ISL-50]MBT2778260.1 glycosyltransferase family 2 protein [Lysobacter sp. ISL-54]MBT2782693.1 glycosyltransferase family 2 protein [Lysobacter sp. ISL-52]